VKRGLLRLQIREQLFGPINSDLIVYWAQQSAIPLDFPVDLDALLTHFIRHLLKVDDCRAIWFQGSFGILRRRAAADISRPSPRLPARRPLLGSWPKPDHHAFAAPKLNVVIDDKTPGLLDRIFIVGANQRLVSYEMTVRANGIRPVICHPKVPWRMAWK
jgi:hypothetical protein